MTVQRDDVWEALATVIDPELGLPITDLGLVYGVDVLDDSVWIEMTTTTPICPLGAYLVQVAEEQVRLMPGVETVSVTLTDDPPWTPDRMSADARRVLGWAT